MYWTETLRYDVVPSKKISSGQHTAINKLLAKSLETDFPERSPHELATIIEQSITTRHNPNKAVGGPTLRKHQTYARSVNVLAYDSNDKLIAAVPAADNASSRPDPRLRLLPSQVSKVAEFGLRQAKLHLNEGHIGNTALITSRWLWLGQPSLSEAARENIHNSDSSRLTVVDGLVMAASYYRDARQPVLAYVYDGEGVWRQGLIKAGLRASKDEPEWIHAFGATSFPVRQERMIAPNIGYVDDLILAKDGARTILAQINW